MYRRVLSIAMGRSGSNAISRWIHAQYPPEAEAAYVLCTPTVLNDDLILNYFAPINNNFEIVRVESVDLSALQAAEQSTGIQMNSLTDRVIVYVWRDPWNHFASLIRAWVCWDELHKFPRIKEFYIPNHKRILRQALGIEKNLPENSIFLNFNEWFVSKNYRMEISAKLDLPTSENGRDIIWCPSGFERGRRHEKGAESFALLDRWKEYWQEPYYRELFKDKELVELASRFYSPPFSVE